jgi:hypothetical protein
MLTCKLTNRLLFGIPTMLLLLYLGGCSPARDKIPLFKQVLEVFTNGINDVQIIKFIFFTVLMALMKESCLKQTSRIKALI